MALGGAVGNGRGSSAFTARELIGWLGTLVFFERLVKTRGTSTSSAFAVSIGRWIGAVAVERLPLGISTPELLPFELMPPKFLPCDGPGLGEFAFDGLRAMVVEEVFEEESLDKSMSRPDPRS